MFLSTAYNHYGCSYYYLKHSRTNTSKLFTNMEVRVKIKLTSYTKLAKYKTWNDWCIVFVPKVAGGGVVTWTTLGHTLAPRSATRYVVLTSYPCLPRRQ